VKPARSGATTADWEGPRPAGGRADVTEGGTRGPRNVTAMNGLADEDDLRLRFDVLTKTKQPELHRYWTTRDRAANVRLYRLAAEILA
jgi:hypothetical protein